MNASDRAPIIALRVCMVSVTCSRSVRPCATSCSTSTVGITPTTRPPAASAPSATACISPTRPPPYTTPILRSASLRPSSSATARKPHRPHRQRRKKQHNFNRRDGGGRGIARGGISIIIPPPCIAVSVELDRRVLHRRHESKQHFALLIFTPRAIDVDGRSQRGLDGERLIAGTV